MLRKPIELKSKGNLDEVARRLALKLGLTSPTANDKVLEELQVLESILQDMKTFLERQSPTNLCLRLRQISNAAHKLHKLMTFPGEPSLKPENDALGLLQYGLAERINPVHPEWACGIDGEAAKRYAQLVKEVGDIAEAASKKAERVKRKGRGGDRHSPDIKVYGIAILTGAYGRLTGKDATISNLADGTPSGPFVDFCQDAMDALGIPMTPAAIKDAKHRAPANPDIAPLM